MHGRKYINLPGIQTLHRARKGVRAGLPRFASAGLTGLLLLVYACAKVGAPTGGVQDFNPPVYVGSEPANRAVNFDGETIEITFDEYIQLKNQSQELLISPPLQKRPVIRIRDKSIRVTLNNELLPLTTYTINFGNAITDNNEGNVLPDFEFVFSTGNTLDSLSVTGKVLNAFDLKTPGKEEEILIMLYTHLSDSAPLVEIPRFIGKAGNTGLFSVNNIPADTFRIIGLRDINNNRIYDPGLESIAFLDSFLFISAEKVKPVTFIKDTVRIIHPAAKTGRSGKDVRRLLADTTIVPGKLLNAMQVSLLYFQEESQAVFLKSKERETAEKIRLVFSRPPHDTVRIKPLNFNPAGEWYLPEISKGRDTLAYWITDTLISRQDTLKFSLAYWTTDSTGQLITRRDTLALRNQRVEDKNPAVKRGRTVTVSEQPRNMLALTSDIPDKGIQALNRPVTFTVQRPLLKTDPDFSEFYRLDDTLSFAQPFTLSTDSVLIRVFRLECGWQEDHSYRLLLKPGAVTDIYGFINDSLEISFTTQREDYYGRILVSLGSERLPLVLQLLDDKEKLLDQQVLTTSGTAVFDFLPPRKYILKAIHDANANGKWDTGNYLKHIQPERVFYHRMTDPVRSNWDHEVSWTIPD
jgi:hypothetical protein